MKSKLKNIVLSAMFTAVICVLSQVAFPTLTVPFTLQTLAIAFCGFMLPVKWSTACVLTYIAIGAFGLPVFSAFRGGAQVIIGPTGGFIWGFLLLTVACSISKTIKKPLLGCIISGLGLLLCHFLGIVQYSIITNTTLWLSFIATSLPFLLKDAFSVLVAFLLTKFVEKRIICLKL